MDPLALTHESGDECEFGSRVLLPEVAEVLCVPGVPNLHRVCPQFYRSGQPSRRGFKKMERMGVKSVISLREYHSDKRRVRGTKISTQRLSMAAGRMTYEHIVEVLCMIRMAPKPLLLHCWHGSDRTGCIVAAYRIVVQGWTLQQAEAEFRAPIYGHHNFWYRNIPVLLRSTDWEKLRRMWQNWEIENEGYH